jgi:hypothetical protein
MVNITVLHKISNIIKTSSKPMKKWSQRSRVNQNGELMRHTKNMVRQIRSVLILVSGNEVVQMLKANFFILSHLLSLSLFNLKMC